MTNKELTDKINQWTYHQMGDQMNEAVSIDVAAACAALASLIPDQLAEYRKVRINPTTLLEHLQQQGELTKNQQVFAIRYAAQFVQAHIAGMKDLQKKVNAICEHIDQFGDEVYQKIDEREEVER